jgi:IS4 transposase
VEGYKRFVDKATSFDFIEYGSMNTYELSFRVVRFPLSDSSYECIVTNLPAGEFSPLRIKEVYFSRWGIESSFRKLKYTIGLSNFHAYKPEYIKQEIWAKLITYNITQTLINHTVVTQKETKYDYKVNFSVAAHICRVFLRLATKKDQIDVMSLLQKELIPIRNERQYPRLKTAHFRRPRYFIYRAA